MQYLMFWVIFGHPYTTDKVRLPLICVGTDVNETTMHVSDSKQREYQLSITCNKK